MQCKKEITPKKMHRMKLSDFLMPYFHPNISVIPFHIKIMETGIQFGF